MEYFYLGDGCRTPESWLRSGERAPPFSFGPLVTTAGNEGEAMVNVLQLGPDAGAEGT